ncbi:MAG: hypothetical protein LBC68_04880 [Prevotellaceae bacterium]|jgi:hypothetical protein|nr:hypothetical protein [Prevotellaceae bacterium]
MKKIIFLIFCFSTISVFAQEKKNFAQKLVDKGFMWSGELSAGGSFLNLKGKGFSSHDVTVSFGYNFTKFLNARIPFGGETALFEKDGERDWAANGTIGLCVGIVPFRFTEDGDNGLIELQLAVGSTTTHKYDWQYTYYDCGINIANGKTAKLQTRFGLRYYDARKSDNRMCLYAALGMRIN